jgi:hypothetical protein
MWHALRVEEVFQKLGTGPSGLNEGEAARRLREYGPNEIAEKRVSPIVMFLRQFKSFLVYILLAAAALFRPPRRGAGRSSDSGDTRAHGLRRVSPGVQGGEGCREAEGDGRLPARRL